MRNKGGLKEGTGKMETRIWTARVDKRLIFNKNGNEMRLFS